MPLFLYSLDIYLLNDWNASDIVLRALYPWQYESQKAKFSYPQFKDEKMEN